MREVTIGELALSGYLAFGDGYRTKRSELADGGFRIIRVADVADGKVALDGPDFVSESLRASIGAKAGQPGDILLTTKGTVGRVAVYEGAAGEVVYSPQLCFFRVGPNDVIDAAYLRHWFRSAEFVHQAAYRKGNTDMADYINLADIRSLKLKLPTIERQRAIAEVLGALDDKIAANRKLVDTILELAALEFKSSAQDGVLVSVDDVAEFHNRRRVPLSASQREEMSGSVPYYGATGRFGTVDRAIFDEILVLVGEDGSVVNDDGSPVTQYVWGPAWVNNHAHVVTGRGISSELLLLALEQSNVVPLVTGAVQAKISMGSLKKLELRVPREVEAAELDRKVQPLFAMRRELVGETHTLSTLRDTLLPRLMSGELRVREAEKQVGAVL